MHVNDAIRMIEEFMQAHGLDESAASRPENESEDDEAGWQPDIAFKVDAESGELKCWALIFQFDRTPSAAFLGACLEEASNGADTGGGTVEYDPADRGLYLTRSYVSQVGVAQFVAELQRLQEASEAWGDEVLDRVFDRAAA